MNLKIPMQDDDIHQPVYAIYNNRFMPLEEVSISPLDRGFLFGDAVYEVLMVHDNTPVWMDRHLNRLQRSLKEVQLTYCLDQISNNIFELIESSPLISGMLYIQITRGAGPRMHSYKNNAYSPNALLFFQPYDFSRNKQLREQGLTAVTLYDERWSRPDIKSVNLLPNCLAFQQAIDKGYDVPLLMNKEGHLLEAPHANLFFVCQGTLVTPPLGPHILHGITRSIMLESALELGMTIEEKFVDKEFAYSAQEIFLTNTTYELAPVISLDDCKIHHGLPGNVARMLHTRYTEKICEERIRAAAA